MSETYSFKIFFFLLITHVFKDLISYLGLSLKTQGGIGSPLLQIYIFMMLIFGFLHTLKLEEKRLNQGSHFT